MKEHISRKVNAIFLFYSEHVQMDRVLGLALSVPGLEQWSQAKFKVFSGKLPKLVIRGKTSNNAWRVGFPYEGDQNISPKSATLAYGLF